MDRAPHRGGGGLPTRRARWWAAASAAAELALPASCGGCGEGRRRAGASAAPRRARRTAFAGGPREVAPSPRPVGLPTVRATTPYDGPVRVALVAFKDEGRRDLCGGAGATADRGAGPGRPLRPRGARRPGRAATSRSCWCRCRPPGRRSGDGATRRCGMLLDVALAGSAIPARGAWVSPALVLRRRVADQAGLDSARRAANLRARHAGAPRAGGRRWAVAAASWWTTCSPPAPPWWRPPGPSGPAASGTSRPPWSPRHRRRHPADRPARAGGQTAGSRRGGRGRRQPVHAPEPPLTPPVD